MESPVHISFTDRELDAMSVLWEVGPATVAEVRERITDDLAYTTVLTILRTLEQKGYVSHTEDGRAHRYKPLVKREVAGRTALRRLMDKVFDGSPELPVALARPAGLAAGAGPLDSRPVGGVLPSPTRTVALGDLDAVLTWAWGLSSAALLLSLGSAALRLAAGRRGGRGATVDGC